MAADDTKEAVCEACRGRGWKLRRSRRSLALGTLARGAATPMRVTCTACDGSGVPVAAVPVPGKKEG